MRILLVSNYFKPSWEAGGEVRTVYDLAMALKRNGHDVTVYTVNYFKVDYGVPVKVPVDVDGVTVYYFDNMMRRFPDLALFPLPFGVWKRASQDIKSFDVVHIHGHRNLMEAIVGHQATSHSVPYLIQSHGGAARHNMRSLKKIYDRLLGDLAIKKASSIIISTPHEKDDYYSIEAPTNDFLLAANGIDGSQFRSLPEGGHFRSRHGIDTSEKILLFVGRINGIKRIDIMIEALSQINSVRDDVTLAIVGPPDDVEYLDSLKEQVSSKGLNKKVMFLGPLYGEGKIEAYVDADVFVLTSEYESFSNTTIEALSCGTPVVISERCSISETLGEFGIVSKGTPSSFADSISILLEDEERRKSMGEKGREYALKRYDWDNVVQEYLGIYEKVIRADDG